MMGNSQVQMIHNILVINEKRYDMTAGLMNLIISLKPDSKLYNANDLNTYKNILNDTNAYRVNYDENERVSGNRGFKYTHIISKLIEKKKEGRGLMMQVNDNPIAYTYWNDPNELVDRLRLLISSQLAGNNNHNNEINSIIEELREAKIII